MGRGSSFPNPDDGLSIELFEGRLVVDGEEWTEVVNKRKKRGHSKVKEQTTRRS